MKLKFLTFLLLLAVSSQVFGQDNGTNIKFVEYDLDNGLHVILHEDHTTPIVAVSIMYHVGSKNENPDKTGFAHFFEHLLFEGSENIKRGEFDSYVENAGGTLNANTSFDRTYYYEILPSNQLELGLWLESERLLHAKVENVGIETQRQVVKEERRQRIDNRPYGSVLEQTMSHLFTEHPYKWPIIGSMAHLDAAVEKDYVDFYKTFYVPNNAVLSIAGDINPAEAKVMIEKYFGTIPKGTREIPRPTVKEPALTAEVRDTVWDNIQLPGVIQGFRIPAQGTDDYYAVDMLATLLSRGESSRFNKKLVDELELALFVGTFPLNLEDEGVALTYGIANMSTDAKVLEDAMDKMYAEVRDELITEREFQKLRNQVESDFIQSNATMAGIAESLANYHMYFGNSDLINNELERYRAVTREDIKRVANKYFVTTNRTTLHYLPKGQKGN